MIKVIAPYCYSLSNYQMIKFSLKVVIKNDLTLFKYEWVHMLLRLANLIRELISWLFLTKSNFDTI